MKRLLLCGAEAANWQHIDYKDKWYSILAEKYNNVDIIYYIHSNVLIGDTVSFYNNYYRFYDADVVVVDFLLEDCIPRNYKKTSISYKVLRKLFGEKTINSLLLHLFRLSGNNASTQLHDYQNYYTALIDKIIHNGAKKVILLKHEYECVDDKLNRLLSKQTKTYSEIMNILFNKYSENVIVIGIHSSVEGDTMNGMCYTRSANKEIARMLIVELNKIIG